MSMPFTQVQPMARSPTGVHRGATTGPATRPPLRHSRTSFGPDIDSETLNAILRGTIDRKSFVLAQQNAFQTFNYDYDAAIAQALQISQETAALEAGRRHESSQSMVSSSNTRSSTSDVDDDLARALRISEETAALEARKRHQASQTYRTSQPMASTSKLPQQSSSSASNSMYAPRPAADHGSAQRTDQPRRADYVQPSVSAAAAGPSAAGSDRVSAQQQKAPVATSSATPAARAPSTHSRPPLRSAVTDVPSSSSSRPRDIPTSPRQPQQQRANVFGSAEVASRQLSREPSSTRNASSTAERVPMKRASASARDLRVGLSMSPGDGSLDTKTDAKRPRTSISPEYESLVNRNLYTLARNCSQCSTLIVSPHALVVPSESLNRQVTDLLHMRCERCATTHCRGCFTAVQCPRRCTGGDSCGVKNCCTQVRAIAIFEALSSFDNEFAAQASLIGWSTKEDRRDFVQLILSNVDKRITQRFEKMLVPILNTLSSWLQPGHVEEQGGLHPSVQHLFAVSYLPEVMRAFLGGRPIKDWVAFSGSFLAILDVLRCMAECGLRELFTEPQRVIEQSCGVQRWMRDQGVITWKSDARNELVYSQPLLQMLAQLQSYQKPLRELKDKIQFPQTVEKAHELYSGLSRLLMLQVMS